ncbi:N-acetylglucosamine-6-phosphate deacetylase [Rhodobacter capsulatus]|uniref:N-acetylglucosamine-6-phosphate deacetylase n=1 Tax=Rhodobacter capsulatus TaxID=1061 RepID=UPI0040274A99
MGRVILTGARLFDGQTCHDGKAVVLEGAQIAEILPATDLPEGARIDLGGGLLAPGLIDLQVNGGGGVMLSGADPLSEIATICAAHAKLGTTGLLPTLITTSARQTRAVLAAGVAAVGRVPGFLGLHLEGPHLDPKRPGCHPAEHIRPMTEDDLDLICEARAGLPALMLTVAPASVTSEQIAKLTEAGVTVALGHAACSFAEAQAAHDAGARIVTHLFNAMSQLGSREPGLVGAALSLPFAAGLIADGIHVSPESARLALRLAGDRLFLVTDAMAVAGTDLPDFDLSGQRIHRANRSLRTENDTLAGADLSLPEAIRFSVEVLDLPPEQALAMATARPAAVIGSNRGRIAPGLPADLVHFSDDWQVTGVWQGGKPQANSPTA